MSPSPRVLVAGAVLVLLALTGCAPGPEVLPTEPDSPIGGPTDVPDGVPAECVEPFPLAFGPADAADLELMPVGWPAEPAEATLCITSETVDGESETADYATPLDPEEVLAHYEAALPDAARTTGGLGTPVVFGAVDGILYQIEPRDGAFRVVFAKADA